MSLIPARGKAPQGKRDGNTHRLRLSVELCSTKLYRKTPGSAIATARVLQLTYELDNKGQIETQRTSDAMLAVVRRREVVPGPHRYGRWEVGKSDLWREALVVFAACYHLALCQGPPHYNCSQHLSLCRQVSVHDLMM